MRKQGFLLDLYSIYKREAGISAQERSRHTIAALEFVFNYKVQMHSLSQPRNF